MVKKASGLSPGHVLAIIKQYDSLWILGVTNIPVLVLLVVVFWAAPSSEGILWATATELLLAVVFAVHGWEPWNMTLEQVGRGGRIPRENYSAAQKAASDFFKTKRCRAIQGIAVVAGAAIPWLIVGLSRFLHPTPMIARDSPIPIWGMCMLGFCDAARGRWIAIYLFAGLFGKSALDNQSSMIGVTPDIGTPPTQTRR